MSDIQIVAEIGCNHNGSVELAKKNDEKKRKKLEQMQLKFQSFVPEKSCFKICPLKPNIRKKNDGNGSQLDMLKKIGINRKLNTWNWYSMLLL